MKLMIRRNPGLQVVALSCFIIACAFCIKIIDHGGTIFYFVPLMIIMGSLWNFYAFLKRRLIVHNDLISPFIICGMIAFLTLIVIVIDGGFIRNMLYAHGFWACILYVFIMTAEGLLLSLSLLLAGCCAQRLQHSRMKKVLLGALIVLLDHGIWHGIGRIVTPCIMMDMEGIRFYRASAQPASLLGNIAFPLSSALHLCVLLAAFNTLSKALRPTDTDASKG